MAEDPYAWMDSVKPPAPPDKVAPGGLRGVITGERGAATGTGEAAARGGLQGATLGFGDEAAAAIDTFVSHIPGVRYVAQALNEGPLPVDNPKLSYQQRRDAYRARNAQAAEDHPVAYHGAELGGALLAPVPGAGAKTLVQAVKTGAKVGAAAGLGGSEADLTQGDFAGAAKDTLIGTATGSAGGAVAHGGATLIRKGVEGAKRRVAERATRDIVRSDTAAKAKTANQVLARAGEAGQDLGDLMSRDPKLETALAIRAESSPIKAARVVSERSEQFSDELAGMFKQMEKGGAKVTPDEILASFDRQMGEFRTRGDLDSMAALRRARTIFADEYKNNGALSATQLRGLKKSAGRAAFAGDPTAPASVKADVQRGVWRVFSDAIERKAEGTGVDVGRLRQLNNDLSVLIPIEQALTERGTAQGRGVRTLTQLFKDLALSSPLGVMAGSAAGMEPSQIVVAGLVAPAATAVGRRVVRRADLAMKRNPAVGDYAARVSAGMARGMSLQAAVEAAKGEEKAEAQGKRRPATSFEANSPGMVEPGNIDIMNRPDVANADGSHSSVRSMSFSEGGPEILVPTVSEDGRIMTEDEAIEQYRKTGRHLGKFKTPEDATGYAGRLHEQQAGLMGL